MKQLVHHRAPTVGDVFGRLGGYGALPIPNAWERIEENRAERDVEETAGPLVTYPGTPPVMDPPSPPTTCYSASVGPASDMKIVLCVWPPKFMTSSKISFTLQGSMSLRLKHVVQIFACVLSLHLTQRNPMDPVTHRPSLRIVLGPVHSG